MNSIMKVKTEARLREWAALIAECQSSGLTIREWCKENGIAQKTYYYRLRKVRERTLNEMAICDCGVSETQSSDNVKFRPLEVSAASGTCETAVTLHMPNATLEVNRGADRDTIEAVLQALKNVC